MPAHSPPEERNMIHIYLPLHASCFLFVGAEAAGIEELENLKLNVLDQSTP